MRLVAILLLLIHCLTAAAQTPSEEQRLQKLQASFQSFPFLTSATNGAGPKFQTLSMTNPVVIDGANYYGFRFTVPKRTNNEDFVWAVVEPADYFEWGIVPQTGPVTNCPFKDFCASAKAPFLSSDRLRPLNRNRVILQSASGSYFKDGESYLIWATFDGKPRAFSLAFTFAHLPTNASTNVNILQKALGLKRASSEAIVSPINHHTYILLRTATWKESEERAVAMGGHLATVRSQAEEDWLMKTFGNYGGTQRLLWIGLSDRDKKFHFTWSSGESVSYTCWAKGEPNNAGRGEDFVAIYYPNHNQHGKWNDWNDRKHDPIGLPLNGVVEIIPSESAQATNIAALTEPKATSNGALALTNDSSSKPSTQPDTLQAIEIAPALVITNDSGVIKLEWSIAASNYSLEATTDLTQPFTMFGYTEVTNPEAGIIYVTITNPVPQMFFRLHKP